MANIPLPSNIVFTRSGDSLFENVTIWGNTNLNTLNVYGESLFYEDATFKKDVRITDLTVNSIYANIYKNFKFSASSALLYATWQEARRSCTNQDNF